MSLKIKAKVWLDEAAGRAHTYSRLSNIRGPDLTRDGGLIKVMADRKRI